MKRSFYSALVDQIKNFYVMQESVRGSEQTFTNRNSLNKSTIPFDFGLLSVDNTNEVNVTIKNYD